MDPLTGGMATDHPPRLCISGAPPDAQSHGQAIHTAIAKAAREAGIDARRLEVVERAKEKLRELIEAREVRLDSREVEVAVFGEPFRVERLEKPDAEGDDIAWDGYHTYRMRYGWLTRDEIVGSICRWCAGIGVNPDLSRNKRLMLWQWQREPAQFTTGPDNTRVVRGVSFDWPYAEYMRHPFAEQIMRELCITDEEARCPRCNGWGDERESPKFERLWRVTPSPYFATASVT